MNLELAKQSFLDHLRIERGLSTNTLISYQRDLELFSTFVKEKGVKLEEIDSTFIELFHIELRNELAPSSTNRVESTLRTFFKYVLSEFGLPNPALNLETMKIPRKLPKALSIDQIISMIEAADRPGISTSLRDRALLELLYGTGARVSELIGINVLDISATSHDGDEIATVKLRGKGGKERIVPLGSFATKALLDYQVRVRPTLIAKQKKADSALFLNSRGTRLSRQSAWQIVLDAATAVGLQEKVSPHVFRHSYATHLLDGGADIRVVQELLGHASVTTTQIYTLVTIDKIRESYSSAHPRAQ
ncbi:MAG: tyrosine recombinase XerD [Actinobacteria bacterium]|nr:tyrosine recombinase XerD [Actinomycetota bacterium]